MTAVAQSLFDAPVTAGTSRHADPASSHEAAKAKRPAHDQEAIHAALVANGGTGTLDTACMALPDRDRGSVSRRLTDLEMAGRIRNTGRFVPGSRGRCVSVWVVVS